MSIVRIAYLAVLLVGVSLGAHVDASDRSAEETQISWADGGLERGLTQAEKLDKRIFVYFGAVWCPPCQHVKGTVFHRPDFVALTKTVIPVEVDFDDPLAPKWADRYHVEVYPTALVLSSSGKELKRLVGVEDPEQYLEALATVAIPDTEIKKLATASKATSLSDTQWMTIGAFKEWHSPQDGTSNLLATSLQALSKRAPEHLQSVRLDIEMLALSFAVESPLPPKGRWDKAYAAESFATALGKPEILRRNIDMVVSRVLSTLQFLASEKSDQRKDILERWTNGLTALSTDPLLSPRDQLRALQGVLELQRVDLGGMSANGALRERIKERVATIAMTTVSDSSLKKATLPEAVKLLVRADLLEQALGLVDKAQQDPILASTAFMYRAWISKFEGAHWYRKAVEAEPSPSAKAGAAEGYLRYTVQVLPSEEGWVEDAGVQALDLSLKLPQTHANLLGLQDITSKLEEWNSGGQHNSLMKRLLLHLKPACGKSKDIGAICDHFTKPILPQPQH